jgi:hypothetical protein
VGLSKCSLFSGCPRRSASDGRNTESFTGQRETISGKPVVWNSEEIFKIDKSFVCKHSWNEEMSFRTENEDGD